MQTEDEKRAKHATYMREWKARKAIKEGRQIGATPRRPANTTEVLWSKVDRRGPDECWPWLAFRNGQGYGRTWINGKGYFAHRVIFELANPGQIDRSAPNRDGNTFVLHTCDNSSCCNPAHLYLGSHADNMRDKVMRGRCPDFKCERRHELHADNGRYEGCL